MIEQHEGPEGLKRIGFAVLVFEYGPGGHMGHASRCERGDLISILREYADNLERGTASTKGDA